MSASRGWPTLLVEVDSLDEVPPVVDELGSSLCYTEESSLPEGRGISIAIQDGMLSIMGGNLQEIAEKRRRLLAGESPQQVCASDGALSVRRTGPTTRMDDERREELAHHAIAPVVVLPLP